MKTADQVWTKHENQMGRIRCTETVTLDIRVATHRHPEGESAALKEAAAVLDMAAAAPDMARALMEERKHHYPLCECGKSSALRKAGIL